MTHTSLWLTCFDLLYLNEECRQGRYGDGCREVCSAHCKNDAVCNHTDGGCPDGCKAGYQGTTCKKGIIHVRFYTNI